MASRTKLVAVLLLAAAMMALAGCGGSKGAGSAPGGAPAATGEQPDGQGAAVKQAPLAIGAKATVGPYSLTVSKVDRMSQIKDVEDKYAPQVAAGGKEFLVLTLDFANDTDKKSGTGPAYFKLADSTGAEYQAFPTNGKDFIFNDEPVPAKGSASTKIAYEAPKDTKGFTLTWEPFVEGGAAGAGGIKNALFRFE